MKHLFTIVIAVFLFILLAVSAGYAQTVIPATTTVQKLDSMPLGQYRFFSPDTVDLSLGKQIHDTIKVIINVPFAVHDTVITWITIRDTIRIHDTIRTVCPIVDTAAIQALKICPICPVCPVIPPQRKAVSLTWDAINKRWIIGYDDNSTTFL